MKQYIKITNFLSLAVICLLAGGCKKMDATYSQYLKTVVYTGKTDSLKVLPGDGRVKLTWVWSADPKVTKMKVYWNSKKDSIVKAVTLTPGIKNGELIITGLPEASYTFEVYTFDNDGHSSIKATASGSVYSATYKSLLLNRPIKDAELIGLNAVINWYTADDKVVNVEVVYTDNTNTQQTVTVLNTQSQTTLPNYKSGTTFKYRTIYLPQVDAIDSFPADYAIKGVYEDASARFLKNYIRPYATLAGTAGYDGTRWGVLSDWTTNAAAKTYGTTIKYGGYDNLNGNAAFGLEKGLTTPAITNGKIFQTILLPAGKYQFIWNQGTTPTGSANAGADPRYVIAAVGTDLPDVANVTTALGSASFAGVATANATFILSQPTTVSLGVVVSFTSTTVVQSLRTHGNFVLKYNPLP
ncbi:MAG: DUF4998 domain-containing protein [Bacteroidota bacterium]